MKTTLVSIHAPARGATLDAFRKGITPVGFQSTRPRGARLFIGVPVSDSRGFNPRARAGRDTRDTDTAPIGGSFNPRARAGRDKWYLVVLCKCIWFQSTRPRGARPAYGSRVAFLRKSFNPRARAGRDY